ncbi:alpha/beta hydrolase fold domain-containing protein [Streptomyces sp. RFCAC02]|uniref:alpha/beta hydrolase fold domain-containing protein n=1 Tax=Streptomyces sp. RFCAC02 TaxID=2499143 RepID=UPI0010213005|nr:alpha/beta hydrolase fold domain-containing protein [Streptomyces sp. RFCAC02]
MSLDPSLEKKLAPLAGATRAETDADPVLRAAKADVYRDERPYQAPPVPTAEEHIGRDGNLRVRVYTPPGPAAGPHGALVWLHGGGFAAGSLDDTEGDTVSREVCARAGVVVVSVDYHLANGTTVTYPALHRQAADAYLWTREHAAVLGTDPERTALGGASAGGNLALAAAYELRARGRAVPDRLVLAYPALHRRARTTAEHERLMAAVPPAMRFPQEALDTMWDRYTGPRADAPLAAFDDADYTGLPPMLVILAEYDDLRVGAADAAERAARHGVDVETYFAAGVFHGHLNIAPTLPETDATLDRVAAYLAPRRDTGRAA